MEYEIILARGCMPYHPLKKYVGKNIYFQFTKGCEGDYWRLFGFYNGLVSVFNADLQ